MENISDIEIFIRSKGMAGAKVVCWLTDRILFGEMSEQAIHFAGASPANWKKYLLRARVFHDKAECHIWKSDGKWWGRYRDNDEDSVVSKQFLLGSRAKRLDDGSVELTEPTGTVFRIPGAWLPVPEKLNDRNRLRLTVRYYYAPNAIGQYGYVDMRFVDIGFY